MGSPVCIRNPVGTDRMTRHQPYEARLRLAPLHPRSKCIASILGGHITPNLLYTIYRVHTTNRHEYISRSWKLEVNRPMRLIESSATCHCIVAGRDCLNER